MTTTPSQTSIDPSQIQGVLEDIGYSLIDFGNHWRTNALYRGGGNQTSLKVYKNSGVWTDYSTDGGKSLPFERLLYLTLNSDHSKLKEILSSLNKGEQFTYVKKDSIEMEEIYPESILQKLFPNYLFYTKKGFSEDTLKFYKTGLAGAGKMYRRMVFPIYNEHKQIIGFSGRKVDESNEQAPKWKHLGKKKNWIYPAYMPNEKSVDSIIKEKREVILVESIGDSMALHECGIMNTLVTFGIGCSPAIINYLNSFAVERIIIATNNDFQSAQNHGYNGAIKILMSLRNYFDFNTLEIKLPPHPYNDFSEAHQNGCDLKEWYLDTADKSQNEKHLKDYLSKNTTLFKSKEVSSLLKTLENHE